MQKKNSRAHPSPNRLYLLLTILALVIIFGLIINKPTRVEPSIYSPSPLATPSYSPAYSPTPAPVYPAPIPFPVSTEGWKTYTNIRGNFTIKYPPDYSHQFTQDINKGDMSASATKNIDIEEWSSGTPREAGGYTGDHIILSIYPNDGKTELPDLGKASQNISLGGQNTLLSTGLGGMIIYVGPILHNGYIYKFQYDLPNQNANANNFYQMVSTFQFLK